MMLLKTMLKVSDKYLSARIFTDFGLLEVIRGQSVTQGSMGRDPPRYPPRGPGL